MIYREIGKTGKKAPSVLIIRIWRIKEMNVLNAEAAKKNTPLVFI